MALNGRRQAHASRGELDHRARATYQNLKWRIYGQWIEAPNGLRKDAFRVLQISQQRGVGRTARPWPRRPIANIGYSIYLRSHRRSTRFNKAGTEIC